MTITVHRDLSQGSEEWLAARCGLITASEMRLLLTPSLRPASNEKARAHAWELLAQRITRHVEPAYIGDEMLRGMDDEQDARALYSKFHAPVEQVGFVTNDRWGFTLGCSPDGMVGSSGIIECKSRRQRFQVETLLMRAVPEEHWMQCQTALLVTEREWLDYVSISAGMPLAVIRVYPDQRVHDAIIEAAQHVEDWIAERLARYPEETKACIPTERKNREEMFL